MNKNHTLSFLAFSTIILMLTSCSGGQFASRKYKKERVTVLSATNSRFELVKTTPHSEDISNNENKTTLRNIKKEEESVITAEKNIPLKNLKQVNDLPVEQTKKYDKKRIERNAINLKKVTETNRSALWLAYGITSFVLGFLAAGFIPLAIFVHPIIFSVIGVAFAILAIIFGIMGLKAKKMRFLPIIGLVLGGGAFIGWIIVIILLAMGSI